MLMLSANEYICHFSLVFCKFVDDTQMISLNLIDNVNLFHISYRGSNAQCNITASVTLETIDFVTRNAFFNRDCCPNNLVAEHRHLNCSAFIMQYLTCIIIINYPICSVITQ